MKQVSGREAAIRLLDLAPDIVERFDTYLALLAKWTARINLVGPATMADPWRRHILDSAQLYRLLPDPATTLADLGSGAGLPGLILAIMGVAPVHLVEADQRKCAFLREAARVTGTAITIHATRIESAPAIPAGIVTARALTSLDTLIRMATRFLQPGGACFFLKGARYADELTAAQESWHMEVSEHSSLSDPEGVVLKLTSLVIRQE